MLRGNSIEPDEPCKMLVPNAGLNGFPLTRWRIALILPGISKRYRPACSENIRPRTFLKFKVKTKPQVNREYLQKFLHITCVLRIFTLLNFLSSKCIKIRCLAVLFKRLRWFEREIIWSNWWNCFFFCLFQIKNSNQTEHPPYYIHFVQTRLSTRNAYTLFVPTGVLQFSSEYLTVRCYDNNRSKATS